jgi:hypothetical protein
MNGYAERYNDLASEFTAYRHTREKDVQYLLDQRDALLAENQRLREALELLAKLNDPAGRIAREALTGDAE